MRLHRQFRRVRSEHPDVPAALALPLFGVGLAVGTGLRLSLGLAERCLRAPATPLPLVAASRPEEHHPAARAA